MSTNKKLFKVVNAPSRPPTGYTRQLQDEITREQNLIAEHKKAIVQSEQKIRQYQSEMKKFGWA